MKFAKNTLEYIVSDIESGHNPFAMRFEPGIYARMQIQSRYKTMVESARIANQCSRETAKIICSISWGQFQIMGFNLYDGMTMVSVGKFMAEESMQAHFFGVFCRRREIYFTPDELRNNPASVLRFAKIYNGSLDYAHKINDRLEAIPEQFLGGIA